MDMDQEVDVKLFITCRMCLDEPGAFQIIPCIKGQINYCFGIDIDPFDGLPQLICKKCKSTLSEYYKLKNKFLGKQQELLEKLSKNNQAVSGKSPAAVDGASHAHAVEAPDSNGVLHAGNASDIAPAGNSVESPPAIDVNYQGSSRKRKASWKKEFDKYFVCSICNKRYLTVKSIEKHTRTHKRIISKHEKIFKNYLTVRLNRIDKNKNSTGNLQNVVYNKDKIISKGGNSNYHACYLRKGFREYNNETDENKNAAVTRPRVSSDSSEDEIIKGKKRKFGRLFSISSTQTVILEESAEKCNNPTNMMPTDNQNNPNETEKVNADHVNLDETSSDCPPKNSSEFEKTRTMPRRQQPKAKVADYKAIHSIVTMCHKNYIKKIQSEADASKKSTFSESSLKHKVLSLGRKVINKQGFSCTGLLRYMEHKDLDITWTPTSSAMQNKGSNFVRIMTKLKSREDSESEDAGWINMHDISFCRDSDMEDNGSLTIENETVGSAAEALPQGATILEDLLTGAPYDSDDLNYKNKLLNKTPVAHPKQLPKKNNLSENKPEMKSVIVKANNTAMLAPALFSGELEEGQVDDSNMCLPIITSTTSLSCLGEKEKQEVPIIEKPPPRIKVKPASELMPERALSNQETVDVWAFNRRQCTFPPHLTNTTVYAAPTSVLESQSYVPTSTSEILAPVTYNDANQSIEETKREGENNRSLEYVTLHCADLPNTRTKSPFNYFKTVLRVHGLKLLNLNDALPEHFNCLVRFQLMLKQDTKKPIKVLLSLFCSKSTFCFTFKDTNSKTFDPNQLSAFWQWELLKVFRGDVVDKILQNAINIGKEVHEFTKHFLCLLKSIDLIIES